MLNFTEIPSPMPKVRLWFAEEAGYSFVIMREMDPSVGAEWMGYTATWKDTRLDTRPYGVEGFPKGTQPANAIHGDKPWQTFAEAELACRRLLMQLKTRGQA